VSLNPAIKAVRVFSVFVSLLLILMLPGRSFAVEEIINPDQYPLPRELNGLHFYLITVDVGDMVWDNFGHTALRVYDENTGSDLVYNWGVFDANDGVVQFAYNFFKGIMDYRLETHTPTQEFAMYRSQQRTLWQDNINLTNPQKEILYRRLQWNLQEENIVYPYQYFFDNCTTKVRDYLNEALGGKLAANNSAITDKTFRQQVQDHYESAALIDFSLDILMNSNVDRNVSEWEEMFLPLSLRQRLLQLESDVAIDGERQKLLSDAQVVMEFPPPNAEQDPYRVASITLLAPVIFLFLMLKKIPMSYFATHSRIGLKAAGINFRILGVLGLLAAAFSGVYGLLMLAGWFVSDHLDLHHNVNLLLFWPTDILGLLVALRWLTFCKPWPLTHNSTPFLNYYMMAHLVAMAVYAVVALFDLYSQSIFPIALYVLPGFALFTVLIWMVGFEPAKPKPMYF
jgi:hypothetical protein